MSDDELVMCLDIVVDFVIVVIRVVSTVSFKAVFGDTVPGLVSFFKSRENNCGDKSIFSEVRAGQVKGFKVSPSAVDVSVAPYFREATDEREVVMEFTGAEVNGVFPGIE